MKWHTDSFETYKNKKSTWHRWFAWYPVWAWEKEHTIWLNWVERKAHYSYTSIDGYYLDYYEYREI